MCLSEEILEIFAMFLKKKYGQYCIVSSHSEKKKLTRKYSKVFQNWSPLTEVTGAYMYCTEVIKDNVHA